MSEMCVDSGLIPWRDGTSHSPAQASRAETLGLGGRPSFMSEPMDDTIYGVNLGCDYIEELRISNVIAAEDRIRDVIGALD